MSIAVVCPGCSAKLNAPDTAAGKKVKCPKCQGPMTVPAPDADFEVVENEPVAPAKKPAPKPAAKPPVKAAVEVDEDDEDEDEDEEVEKPKKKGAKAASEDDEKPRKKKPKDEDDSDDEEDEKPKKKKKKKKAAVAEGGGSSLARNLIGGAVLIILLGVVAFVFYDKFGKKKEEVVVAPKDDDPPIVRPQPKPPDPKQPGPKPPEPKAGRVNQKIGVAQMGGPVLTGDGKLLLARHVIGSSMLLGIWDVPTGNQFASIGDEEKYAVNAYGISPDRKQVAIVSLASKTLTLWSAPDGQLQKTIKLTQWKDGTRTPSFATYTTDGKFVLTAYEGSLLRVEVQTGTQQVVLKDIDTTLIRYNPEANRSVDVFYNPAGKTELRVIDLDQPAAPILLPLKEDESPQSHPDISADGKTVAAVVVDRTDFQKPTTAIHVYDVASRALKAKIPFTAEPKAQLDEVSVSPDGSRVAFCARRVRAGANESASWVVDANGQNVRQLGSWGKNSVQITTFAPDGKTVAVLSDRLRIYNVETGKDVTP